MAKKGKDTRGQGELGDIREGDRVLDNVTKNLARIRGDMNPLREAEKLEIARGLKRMQDTGRETYTKNGIELFHTTTDKLRVRLVDDSTGEVEEGSGDE